MKNYPFVMPCSKQVQTAGQLWFFQRSMGTPTSPPTAAYDGQLLSPMQGTAS